MQGMVSGVHLFKLFRSTPKPAPAAPERPERRRHLLTGAAARTALAPADQVLSSAAQAWLQGLTPGMRPHALASLFPRIVNRLALVWPDPVLTLHYFDSLMIDRRGDRKGFPPAVMQELIDLRAHYGTRAPEAPHATQLAMEPIEFS